MAAFRERTGPCKLNCCGIARAWRTGAPNCSYWERRNVKKPLDKGELARYGLDLARVQASKSGTPLRRAGKTRRGNLQAFRLGRVSKHAVRELRLILYNLARRFSLSRQVSVATTNALA